MKRGLLAIIIAAVLIGAAVYAWHAARKSSATEVSSLLPRDTIALVHLTDFNRARDDWKHSDIYQLYAEPSVQEFLRHPLARHDGQYSDVVADIEQLGIRDAFAALISVASDNTPHLVAGFRFAGSRDAVQKKIDRWLRNPNRRETVDYQQHKIDVLDFGIFSVAEVYDGQWFFAANNLDDLKLTLDRADGHVTDPKTLLTADENFHAAMSQMPGSYALGFYVQPRPIAEKLAQFAGQSSAGNQQALLEKVQSIAATARFEKGKIHDFIFVGSSDTENSARLSRESVTLGTGDTFLYVASLLNLSKQIALLPTGSMGFLGGGLQKINDALARAGIGLEQWQAAFGSEVGVLADWRTDAHWPSGVAVFPVKDVGRAKQLASVLAHALDEDASWVETDRNGVHYITMQAAPGFLVMRPTIAVTDRRMIVGMDSGSVDAAVERSRSSTSGLSNAAAYKTAASMIPAPTNFFAYLDLALLYTRLDTTVRPILMMGAAFMPGVNNSVDLSRVPAPEIVAKHLSPIVSSQHNVHGGYLTESIGPITLNDGGLALAALAYSSTFSKNSPFAPFQGGHSRPFSPPASGGAGRGIPGAKTPSPTPAFTP